MHNHYSSITLYADYVHDRESIIHNCLENVVPHPVLSFDHTFRIQKKTLEYDQESKTYESVPENAVLFLMNGNGEVVIARLLFLSLLNCLYEDMRI